VRDYPQAIGPALHTEPVPRRIRATLAGATVFDTTRALYVWESPKYPQYYIPRADVDASLVLDEAHAHKLRLGSAQRYGLRAGEVERPGAARLYTESKVDGVAGTFRFDWDALDHWFEEDEEVFVHPRCPYTRVDTIRSTRSIRIELDGKLLAQTRSPVMVFETGRPTRYYLNRTEVDFTHLEPSDRVEGCPYKGQTSGYWSARIGAAFHEDIAWCYDFPTRAVTPIAGLIAFYNERVDTILDGRTLERPGS
jgi:uncharacterized protein (DUF427 family)